MKNNNANLRLLLGLTCLIAIQQRIIVTIIINLKKEFTMKLKLALLSVLLMFGTATAQAADTRTPDILSSVSSSSVQKMSVADSSKARGEYFRCGKVGYCGITWSKTKLKTGWHDGTYTKYLFKVRKYGFFGPVKYYVAR